MENLLTTISTTQKNDIDENFRVVDGRSSESRSGDGPINSPERVLEILKHDPDLTLLRRALRWLNPDSGYASEFSIKKSSPKATQIIFVLVNETVPHYWQSLNGKDGYNHIKEKKLLVSSLCSIAGIGAVLSRLRSLLQQLKIPESQRKRADPQSLSDLLNLLEHVLDGYQCLATLWKQCIAFATSSAQKSLQWKEILSLIASGKLLATASEASLFLSESNEAIKEGSWTGNGALYSRWLGENVQCWNLKVPKDNIEDRRPISQLLSKALHLGYKDHVVKATFRDLLDGDRQSLGNFQALLSLLSAHDQKTNFYTLVEIVSQEKLKSRLSGASALDEEERKAMEGAAALVNVMLEGNNNLQDSLVDWLVGLSAVAPAHNHITHRMLLAVLASDKERLCAALQKCLELFGDKLYIKHTPILHQEVTTQVLLLLAGYCLRANRSDLANTSQSSTYLNAISNRLAASSPRARFLGMVVGTAISELVDPQDKRMKFGTEELSNPDGLWYRNLPSIKDSIGSIEDLKIVPAPSTESAVKPRKAAKKESSTKPPPSAKPASKIVSIEEIEENPESEDEDLPSYAKPDSDPSDEDEDPTLVQRDKPTAPVYIRDLITGLRDTENFDRHNFALTNAASLIRRKASFGTEVSDNIEVLATLLVGLSDKWDIEDFQKLRLQGMIAVLTAEPLKMGQWFSKTFYAGDYSMGQRASILTTLGLGARELAGLGKEDAALTGANASIDNAFPSKRLPDKLHKIYALEAAAPMDTLTTHLSKTILQPMAASAADQITGPSALKIRTFSSRLSVEKKRQKPIPNALAKIVSEGFFFPLTGLWRIHLLSHSEKTSTHTTPFLLAHLIKTLALILHASGPSTLSLPSMTSEFWDFLLSLRARVGADASVLEALLFAFLTLLEVNADEGGGGGRRLAEEQGKELLETQGWVEGVMERVGGGSEEGERVRVLAAGVLVRTREVVKRYQRVLMGELVDFM